MQQTQLAAPVDDQCEKRTGYPMTATRTATACQRVRDGKGAVKNANCFSAKITIRNSSTRWPAAVFSISWRTESRFASEET